MLRIKNNVIRQAGNRPDGYIKIKVIQQATPDSCTGLKIYP